MSKNLSKKGGVLRNIIVIFAGSLIVKMFVRLVNNTMRSVIPLFSISINGQVVYAHTFDRIIALLLLKLGILEKREMDFVKKTVKEGWTVIDIGANIGYYTLLLSKLVGKNGKVIAFEPDKDSISMLKKNIKHNNCRNVQIVPMAVSDHSGSGTLYISNSHSGDHRIYDSFSEKRKKLNL